MRWLVLSCYYCKSKQMCVSVCVTWTSILLLKRLFGVCISFCTCLFSLSACGLLFCLKTSPPWYASPVVVFTRHCQSELSIPKSDPHMFTSWPDLKTRDPRMNLDIETWQDSPVTTQKKAAVSKKMPPNSLQLQTQWRRSKTLQASTRTKPRERNLNVAEVEGW